MLSAAGPRAREAANLPRGAVVACDFDGTITRQDLGLATMEQFADGDWWAVETRWREGEISSMECLRRQFDMVKAAPEELRAFYEQVPVDPAFPAFAEACRGSGVGLVILSDGLDFYIDIVLERMGLGHVPYFANHLVFDGARIVIEFPHRAADCSMCGNCKRDHVKRLRRQYDTVAFIGDGHSDRCVVRHASPIFAKSHLSEYCLRERVPFTRFESFEDLLWVPGSLGT